MDNMKITLLGLKQYSPSHTFRMQYKIEHKGKSIEYMPPNTWGFSEMWRSSVRNCLIRTLKSKYNEVWA